MASTTVIDQLIVKLGLDPRDFAKGEKEVAASVLRTKDSVRKQTSDMSEGFEQAAGSFARSGGLIAKVFSKGGVIGLGIAATIAALKIANDKLYDIAESTRQLGLDSRNFNTSAAGLRNMQNAAELAGGAIGDATNSASGLGKSLFDLKFNGAISDSLVQLARLGVRFTDASGKARDFKDVALDTAEALGKAQANGTMSRAEAFQFAQQTGFQGGLANLVADGRPALEAALAKQGARRQVNGRDVAAATDRVQASESLSQATLAELGVPAMTASSGLNAAASRGSERLLTGGARGVGDAVDYLGKAATKAGDALARIGKDVKDTVGAPGQTTNSHGGLTLRAAWQSQKQWFRQQAYQPALDAAADKYGIDRDVFTGIARTESGFRTDAEAKDKKGNVTGRGIMQLNPQFYKNAGKDPYSDIDTAGRVFSDLLTRTEGDERTRYATALRMYNAGETNYRTGRNLGKDNEAYPGKVLAGTSLAFPTPAAQGAAGGTSNRTDVTFEQVTINTQSKDGERLATDFTDATRRKLIAAQADAGVQ